MKQFNQYHFFHHQLKRLVKKSAQQAAIKMPADRLGDAGLIAHMESFAANMPSIGKEWALIEYTQSMDGCTLYTEHKWMHEDRRAVFPRSSEEITKLISGKMSLDSISALNIPEQTFIFHFPSDYKVTIEGKTISLPSVLVSYTSLDTCIETGLIPFAKSLIDMSRKPNPWTGRREKWHFDHPELLTNLTLARLSHVFTDEASDNRNRKMLRLFFADPFSDGGLIRSTAQMYDDDILELVTLSDEDYEGFFPDLSEMGSDKILKEMMRGSQKQRIGGIDQEPRDNILNGRLLSIIGKFLVFSHVAPNSLSNGFPIANLKTKTLAPEKNLQPSTLNTFSVIVPDADRNAHYRSWFMRQLRHEKYYKGEFKDYKPGSRVVFVSPTMVGEKVSAETFRTQQ